MEGDESDMIEKLSVANYHRLTAYWHPFRTENHSFAVGTNFTTIWRRYTFDRQLKLLVLDAIERFEVTLRTQFAFHHSKDFGPFGYYENPSSFPKLRETQLEEYKEKVRGFISNYIEDPYVSHFMHKYGANHSITPIWATVEFMDFGTLVLMYQNTSVNIKRGIAEKFGVPRAVLGGWMLSLLSARNICAHHGRLWNRTLGVSLKELPADRFPDWHFPDKVAMNSTFALLKACHLLLCQIAPRSRWPSRVNALLAEYEDIPKDQMGFPPGLKHLPELG